MQATQIGSALACVALLTTGLLGCGDSDPSTRPAGDGATETSSDGLFDFDDFDRAACLRDDGSCVLLTEDECDAIGGTFQGEDTDCCPRPCPHDHHDHDNDRDREWCGLGFWKNHPGSWPSDIHPDDPLHFWFDFPDELDTQAEDSLSDALRYHGGSGRSGGTRLLLRDAVVALLNAAHPDLDCHEDVDDVDEVISIVNRGLHSLDRQAMQRARHHLKVEDADCPLD